MLWTSFSVSLTTRPRLLPITRVSRTQDDETVVRVLMATQPETADMDKIWTARAFALVTAVISGLISAIVPFGNDTAAHLYLTKVFSQSGYALWDNLWYFGRYDFVGYSYTYYPLASLVGVKPPAVGGLVLVVYVIVRWALPRNSNYEFILASALVSVTVSLLMLTGAYPFLLSMGLAAGAISLYARGARTGFVVMMVVASATSPLALAAVPFVVLYLALLRLPSGSYRAKRYRSSLDEAVAFVKDLASAIGWESLVALMAIAAVLLGVEVYLNQGGTFPYYGSDFGFAAGFCIAVLLLSRYIQSRVNAFALRVVTVMYFAFSCVAFVVHSGLGGNVARVGEVAPTIVIALWLRRDRKVVVPKVAVLFGVVFLGCLGWMSTFVEAPLLDPTQQYLASAKNWELLSATVHRMAAGDRVEYVDSLLHEGDYFLPAAGISIARGWFRQQDFPQNRLFYGQNLTKTEYDSWLCTNQIAMVVLPPGPYDYSSVNEAFLVTHKTNFLILAGKLGRFETFKVSGCPVPRAKVTIVSRNVVAVNVSAAGNYVIPVNYSRTATVSFGSLKRRRDGRIELIVPHRGLDIITG